MNVLANLWGKGKSLDQSIDELLESSGLTLFSCLLTTALCLIIYILASQPENIIKWAPYLATSNADDDIYVTADILKLRNTDLIEKKIILIGDSSIREAIYEDQLQKAILSAGLNYRVIDLRTGGQTLLESLATVDKLPPTDMSVVVTGISLRKFVITEQHIENAKNGVRIGFSSESLDNYLQQSGHDVTRKIGIYGFDNFRFLAPRIIDFAKRPFSEPIALVKHQSLVRPIPSDERFRELEKYFLRDIDFSKSGYRTQTTEGRVVFEILHRLITSKNYSLFILESPLNPKVIKDNFGGEFYDYYLSENHRYFNSFESGLSYFNPLQPTGIQPSDYRDVNHLQSVSGIQAYTDAVSSQLISYLEKQ